MKTVKTLIVFLLTAMIAFNFVSCSDDDDSSTFQPSPSNSNNNDDDDDDDDEEEVLIGQWSIESWHSTLYRNDDIYQEKDYAKDDDFMIFHENEDFEMILNTNDYSGHFEIISDTRVKVYLEQMERNIFFDYVLDEGSLTLDAEIMTTNDGDQWREVINCKASR